MDRIQRNLSQFENVSQSYAFAATDDYSSTVRALIAAKVGFTVYIQKIILDVLTDNAATQTFQDTAGTPVVLAVSKASPGLSNITGPIIWDFGPEGHACTADKGLSQKNSAAGLAAHVTILAYRKRTPDTAWVGNSASLPAGYGTGT